MAALFRTMAEDVRGMVVDRGQGRLGYVVSATLKIALYPRIRAVLLFRIANAFYKRRLGILAYAIQAHILKISGAELHPAANIGPGFCLVHSNGVVIGDRATIGAHFICMHQVTVGDSGKGGGQPTIGEWVTASAGSKILGGITVGDQAVIGANSVVLADVPPKGVAVGSPARVVKIRE